MLHHESYNFLSHAQPPILLDWTIGPETCTIGPETCTIGPETGIIGEIKTLVSDSEIWGIRELYSFHNDQLI